MVGDGALGMWSALGEVFPETLRQRCWVHKAANILSALPKSAHPSARRALAEIRDAEDRSHAEAAIKAFADGYGAKWPKAVAKVTDDRDELLTFFDFPAEHWVHLKTTNPMVHVCHHEAQDQGDQRTGVQSGRAGHGLQAHRIGPGPLAGGERPAPRGSRSSGREVREGGDDRAVDRRSSEGRRVINQEIDPQVLTISRATSA
jgi:hypothetical protein